MAPEVPLESMMLPVPHEVRAAAMRPLGPPAGAAGSSLYLRLMRPVLGALLVAAITPAVAVAVATVAILQAVVHRDIRRVFFIQERAGRFGEPFRIVKFRTMEPDEDGIPRPTRFGALLRKSHMDELPQLWNVLKGEMSLIGPRPETLDLEAWAEKEIPGFQARLVMRPGITGLAQVIQDSTPAVTALYREKLAHNERYLREVGLGMDLWILKETALRPLWPRVFEPAIGDSPLKAG